MRPSASRGITQIAICGASASVSNVSTSQVAASYLLPPVLAAMRVAEPGIEIELVASNQLTNLLRREADIAVRMVRPAQASLVAKKLADIAITACAHESYLARAGALLAMPALRKLKERMDPRTVNGAVSYQKTYRSGSSFKTFNAG